MSEILYRGLLKRGWHSPPEAGMGPFGLSLALGKSVISWGALSGGSQPGPESVSPPPSQVLDNLWIWVGI